MEWIVGLQALLQATVRMAAPLTFTAVGETYGERAGVINIGLEGLMLIGAVTAYAVALPAAASGWVCWRQGWRRWSSACSSAW